MSEHRSLYPNSEREKGLPTPTEQLWWKMSRYWIWCLPRRWWLFKCNDFKYEIHYLVLSSWEQPMTAMSVSVDHKHWGHRDSIGWSCPILMTFFVTFLFISYLLLVALIKHQGRVWKEEFIQIHSSRGIWVHHGDNRSKNVRAPTIYRKHKTERMKQDWGMAVHSQSPLPGMCFLHQGCTATLMSTPTWRPSIQKPEPTGHILVPTPHDPAQNSRNRKPGKFTYWKDALHSKERIAWYHY